MTVEPFFEDAVLVDAPGADDALIVELEGFEGPLDMLLSMARSQKVDLLKISVMELADQYLAFVESVRRRRLELAADYLVMAAWLTYLKSRLVLPQPSPETAGAEEMAAQLRWRLARLQAMREAAAKLYARDLLNRDVFGRGQPESITLIRTRRHTDTLFELLSAYSRQRIRRLGEAKYSMPRPEFYLIEDARARIERMLGALPDWRPLSGFLPTEWTAGFRRRTGMASTFSAALELVRDGKIAMHQATPFGDIKVRDRINAAGEGGA